MKKLISWLKESHQLTHFGFGFIIGFLSDDNYCAIVAGVGVATAIELKDKINRGNWYWSDFGLTLAGTTAGRLTRYCVCGGV